jgi:site-specific DNA-cytosine methylase
MKITVLLRSRVTRNCQARFWRAVGVVTLSLTLIPATIPAADLWCAGWPCQDLSTANTERTGLSGKRSGLFFTFMDLVREVRPAWLVMENVPGLLSMDRVGAADGVFSRLDGRRWRLIGNAVVPTISEWIGKRILEIERLEQKNMASDRSSLNHITS